LGADFQTESYKKYEYLASLSQLGMVYFSSQYTGQFYTPISKITDKHIAPILEEDMSIFPDTMIVSAGCDVLLTHQMQFKNKMSDKCEQIILDGAVHGFMTYGKEFDHINTNVLKHVSGWINKDKAKLF
jgi:acetyl esterase/lipase